MLIDNDFIINLRASTGLSQARFADSLGVKQATIGFIEKGTRAVPKSVMQAVQRVYGDKLCEMETGVKSFSVPIPFYNVGAAAGAGTYLDQEPESDVLYFDERWLRNIRGVTPKNLHLIFASGDSMDSGFNQSDDIKDGDLLMVDSSQTEGNNKIYVLLVNGSELRVKKVFKKLDGSLHIVSSNQKYKDEIYTPDDSDIEIKVIGRVVWNGSKENI